MNEPPPTPQPPPPAFSASLTYVGVPYEPRASFQRLGNEPPERLQPATGGKLNEGRYKSEETI